MSANESWLGLWAVARSLGITDAEFWLSTVAKIVALRDEKEQLDKRRDFFIAKALSVYMNSLGIKITGSEVLSWQYQDRSKSVVTTLPLDVMGAQGDWQSLRQSMMGRSNRPTGRKR